MEENFNENNQFVCYFCNDLIKNDTPESHLAVCGLVLEPCPNKCGAYVQRRTKKKHLKECPNAWRYMVNLIGNGSLDDSANKGAASLDRRLQKPQTTPELTTMYRNMQMELSRICGRLQTLEQSQRNNNSYDSLNKKSQEEYFSIKNAQTDLRRAIEKLQYHTQIVFEWKRHVDTVLESLKQQCKALEKIKEDSDKQLLTTKSGQTILDSVIADVNLLQTQFNEDRIYNREIQNDLKTKIDEFKDFYMEENATVAALWNDQKCQVDETLQNIEKLAKVLEEQKLKFNTVIFDLRSVAQTASESAQKVDILERDFAKINSDVAQIRLDQEISGFTEAGSNTPENHSCGRLLWKITDFAVKIKDAKENGVVLKSPAFYTHEYGYKVRLLLYLDGIKKWKGRHMLVGVHVLKGEYDLLQKWPCHIEGNIIIHDLLDRINPRVISKHIVAKRLYGDEENEEPDENSSQYVFISHSALLKERYIREDSLFMEMKVIPKVTFEATSV